MQISIEKLIYGGDGLAHLPADSSGRQKAAFIPFVLTGETVEASIREQKAGFVRAQLERVVEPSPARIDPDCPYFARCGGCHYQHTGYDHQLEIKGEILRETLQRTAKIEIPVDIQLHPSPPWNYRNRSRLQVRTGPDFSCGYYRLGSHELLGVEQCPISSTLINRGIALLWESGRAGKVPQGVREVEFFADANDAELLIELSCTNEVRRAAARSWSEDLRTSMPQITGVVAFRETSPATRHTPEKFLTSGADHLTYTTQRNSYRVTAASFFQTNRYLIDKLVGIVGNGQSGEVALDLYAGVGLFSTALAGDFHHIVSVESSQTSSADLSYNQTSNGEAVQATTEQYLARLEDSGRVGKGTVLPNNFHRPDLAVVDPPRSGLGERVARMLVTLGAPRVVYVSCDPSTLARDLAVLLKAGYRLEQVHLVDLFPQTFHLETVVHLVR